MIFSWLSLVPSTLNFHSRSTYGAYHFFRGLWKISLTGQKTPKNRRFWDADQRWPGESLAIHVVKRTWKITNMKNKSKNTNRMQPDPFTWLSNNSNTKRRGWIRAQFHLHRYGCNFPFVTGHAILISSLTPRNFGVRHWFHLMSQKMGGPGHRSTACVSVSPIYW